MENCSEEIMGHEIDTGSTTLNSVWIFQICWGQISFILGLSGNVFVLYATILHNAIKLDKMSVWIVKNLAVADICNCLLLLLPILLTQYGKLLGTLLFEEWFYIVMSCYMYLFFAANIFLVNFLSVNKLIRCMFPLRNLYCSRRERLTVTVVTILSSSVTLVWQIYIILNGISILSENAMSIGYLGFDHATTISIQCKKGQTEKVLSDLILIILIALPCLSLIILNSALVILAVKKSNTSLNKRNLLIVIIMVSTFLLSFVPYLIVYLLESTTQESKEITAVITYLSLWNNPLIYFAVNRNFNTFVKERIFFRK